MTEGSVTPFPPAFERAKAELLELEQRLKSGGGDGTSGGMEARVAKLEADVAHLVKQAEKLDARLGSVVTDLGVVRIDIATIKERVSHLPEKDWIATRFQVYLGITVAAIVIATAVSKFI